MLFSHNTYLCVLYTLIKQMLSLNFVFKSFHSGTFLSQFLGKYQFVCYIWMYILNNSLFVLPVILKTFPNEVLLNITSSTGLTRGKTIFLRNVVTELRREISGRGREIFALSERSPCQLCHRSFRPSNIYLCIHHLSSLAHHHQR